MELERAQHNVDLMLVHAPMDGIVVLQTIYRGGDMGPAQQGDQLYSGRVFMQVIDPRSMLLNASVNQVDGERIRIGMKAKVHLDAYPGAGVSRPCRGDQRALEDQLPASGLQGRHRRAGKDRRD